MTNDKGYSGAYHTSGGLWGVSDNEDTQYRVHTSQSGGGGSHNHGFTGSLAETSKNNNPTGGPSKKDTGNSTKNKTDPPNTDTTGNPNAEAIMEVPTMPPYLSVYMWKRTA